MAPPESELFDECAFAPFPPAASPFPFPVLVDLDPAGEPLEVEEPVDCVALIALNLEFNAEA
jgi:hypothetical protein